MRLSLRLIRSLVLSALIFSTSLYAADGPVYDEIFDAVGNLRSHYVDAYAIYKKLSESEKRKLIKEFRRDFRGDNAMHPMPRVMLESEVEMLRKGVSQRGEAIRRFLEDHFSGSKTYQQASIFDSGALDRLFTRYFENTLDGKVDGKSIAFVYGPDVIRGPDGGFYVIEDNHGFVGGMGDLITAREALFQRIPEYAKVLDVANNPAQFYDELVAMFKKIRRNKGPIVMLSPALSQTSENEDIRLRKIMKERGVELVSPSSQNKLVMEDGKAFLIKPTPSGGQRKVEVGYIYLHGEPQFYTGTDGLYRERNLTEVAREYIENLELVKKEPKELTTEEREWQRFLQKFGEQNLKKSLAEIRKLLQPDSAGKINYDAVEQHLRSNPYYQIDFGAYVKGMPQGLIEAIAAGRVPSSYSPGTELISDKEFYVYVEKLVRHYMKEEPILRNLPTESIASRPELIEEFVSKPNDFVVKKVDGRGGSEVYIGAKMKPAGIKRIADKMRADKSAYIIQRKTSLSQFDGLIVDQRLLSFISREGQVASYVPWGRGQLVDGDGKVNLSESGREVAIIPVKDPSFPECGRVERSARVRGLLN
jgi:uncharacterized circularly permuted ATP-grasp superfamily protein